MGMEELNLKGNQKQFTFNRSLSPFPFLPFVLCLSLLLSPHSFFFIPLKDSNYKSSQPGEIKSEASKAITHIYLLSLPTWFPDLTWLVSPSLIKRKEKKRGQAGHYSFFFSFLPHLGNKNKHSINCNYATQIN